MESSSPKAVCGKTVNATLLQGIIDPSQMLWFAATRVLTEYMEEVLSFCSLLLYDVIFWVFGQESEHELELLLVHRVLHCMHQVVTLVEHEVR